MPPRLHAIITTHTARHLRTTLFGVACQSRRPVTITVSCDTDDAAVAETCHAAAGELGTPIVLVRRRHTGTSRSSQVRNNGVRALLRADGLRRDDRLVFLDGDCCPAPGAFVGHSRLARPRGVVVGHRIDLDDAQTRAMDLGALASGRWPVEPTPEQCEALTERHRAYEAHAFLRLFGLTKPHKPKVLSANFSVSLADYASVNGFDEAYEGYGQEDDDFGRRLYRSGCRPVVGVRQTVTLHQWHPTRAPEAWEAAPNVPRFVAGGPARCARGLERPLPQPALAIARFEP